MKNYCFLFPARLVAALLLVVLAALVPSRAAADCVPPPSGLVGWWSGDGFALDLTTNQNNGTLQGGASYAPGFVGPAFSFNGATQYVQISDSPSLEPASVTLECWFNASNTTGLLIGKPVGAAQFDSYAIWLGGGYLNGVVANSSAGPTLSYALTPVPGVWYHAAYTFDSNSQTQTLYLNGVSVASGPANLSIGYDSHTVNIGIDFDYGSPVLPFTGEIDEASIYNRALSAAEIAAIYSAGSAGKCKALQILAQPQSQGRPLAEPATFSVAASGNLPLSYQWFMGSNPVSGATNGALTIASLQQTNFGGYWVVVTNMSGSVTSAVATLTLTNVYDAVADFSASANPNGFWSYGWATSAGGQFILMTNTWSYEAAAGYYNGNTTYPYGSWIARDFGSQVVTNVASYCIAPDSLFMNPQGYASIVRFTAPSNGTYQVQGFFQSKCTGSQPVHYLNIILNTNITAYFLSTPVIQYDTAFPFSFPFNLNQGDTLDFIVSCENGNGANLETGLAATVTPVTNVLAQCFDAVADFSTNANPNGVWTYGYWTNFATPFQILTNHFTMVPGVPLIEDWYNGGTWENNTGVNVVGDFTGSPYSETGNPFPNVVFYPDTLLEDPEGFVVTVRFTAPSDGIYGIQGFFRPQDTTGANPFDVMILTNSNTGSPIYNQPIPAHSYMEVFAFNTTNFLSQGTPLDFIVAATVAGPYLSTGLKATVTPLSPILMTPPASQTVAQGNPAVFSVTAWGTPPLSYQWFRAGAPLSDGGGLAAPRPTN